MQCVRFAQSVRAATTMILIAEMCISCDLEPSFELHHTSSASDHIIVRMMWRRSARLWWESVVAASSQVKWVCYFDLLMGNTEKGPAASIMRVLESDCGFPYGQRYSGLYFEEVAEADTGAVVQRSSFGYYVLSQSKTAGLSSDGRLGDNTTHKSNTTHRSTNARCVTEPWSAP